MEALGYDIPEPGHITRLADDLFWARFDLPFRLNHINLYMLDTDDGWVLIDCGIDNVHTKEHWDALLNGPLSQQRISQILVTHHHVDHIGYCGALCDITGAEAWTSAKEGEHAHWLYAHEPADFAALMVKTYTQYDLAPEAIEEVRHRGSRYREKCGVLPSFNLVEDGYQITTNAGVWTARIDKGHSDAHISLMDKNRNLFISIDFLLPRISPNISADIRDTDDDLLAHYFQYLTEMQALPEDMHIFPGHDWPFIKGNLRATALIEHHHMRLDQLEQAAKSAPLTVSTAMDVLFGRMFGEHELYFASGEARAHLNNLKSSGRLIKQQDDAGIDRYYPS